MPQGYLVSLGDNSLDTGDAISGAIITFATNTNLGSGNWVWSGTYGGQTYTNVSEPGTYYLATNGNVYFVPQYGPVNTISSAQAVSPPTYVGPDGTVTGTGGNDLIDENYSGDPDGDKATAGNDIIRANGGNDTVFAGAGNDSVDGGTGNDTIFGGAGNDTLDGGTGSDTIYGDGGTDSITGGDGADVIYGDSPAGTAATTLFRWDQQSISDETSVTGGLNGTTVNGQINVNMTITQDANFTEASMETSDALYNFDGRSDTSSIYLNGGNAGTEQNAVTMTLDFSAAQGGYSDSVSNVTFGLFDVDQFNGQFIDQIIIRAYDADNNLITVNLSAGNAAKITTSTAANGTATATAVSNAGNVNPNSIDGFVRVTVPGPVARIEIDYNNVHSSFGNHAIHVGDLQLTSIPAETGAGNDVIDGGSGNDIIYGQDGNDSINGGAGVDSIYGGNGNDRIEGGTGNDYLDGGAGNDSISGDAGSDTLIGGAGNDSLFGGSGNDRIEGGAGEDTLFGGTGSDTLIAGSGNDVINFSEGDTVTGDDGDDRFVLEDLGETSNGNITITGGNGAETLGGGDTLQLGDLADLSTLVKVSNGINASGNETFSGSVTLDDGTLLEFSEIENIICFTPGTLIATPRGARDIATLRVGDLVVTRDHGLQPIRWIQSRTVPAQDRFAPIRIRPGVVTGLERDILVSPQHRMLFQGYRSELLFGESEVLIAAKHLVDGKDVTQDEGGMVTYIHMMFDEHEIVFAEGCASESFHPGNVGLTAVTDAAREELFTLFPGLRSDPNGYGPTARRCLKRHEAELVK